MAVDVQTSEWIVFLPLFMFIAVSCFIAFDFVLEFILLEIFFREISAEISVAGFSKKSFISITRILMMHNDTLDLMNAILFLIETY